MNTNENITLKPTNLNAKPQHIVFSIDGDYTGVVEYLSDEKTNLWVKAFLSLQENRIYLFLDFNSLNPTETISLINAQLNANRDKLFSYNKKYVFSVTTLEGEVYCFSCSSLKEVLGWKRNVQNKIRKIGTSSIALSQPNIRNQMKREAYIREKLQEKVYKNWINHHLRNGGYKELIIKDICKDLSDGIVLCRLAEIITQKTLRIHLKPTTIMKKLENLSTFINFIQQEEVKLMFVSAEDILDGKKQNIMSLIWALIYQLENKSESRGDLLKWVRETLKTVNIGDQRIDNFDTCFQSGIIFNALLYSKNKNLIHPKNLSLNQKDFFDNLKIAFENAKNFFQIENILEPNDLIDSPDEHSIMTFCFLLKKAFQNL
eukprot:Anaeramoba_ignava/a479721_14.p1 GENE.a479721_14~~a479721_14.p1  ORF type:complete len:386 (-),score=120.07 a479721_14:51-1172(-)